MKGRHAGRVVIVTGGSAGIGGGAAAAFAEQGALVVVHGLEEARVEEAVEALTAGGGTAVGVAGDVAEEETHQRLVDEAMRNFGRIDHLVTSAGIQTYGDALSTTPEDFDRVFAVNVRGVFLAIRAAITEIRKNAGTITLISSVQGVASQNNVVGYAMTKGGLNAMCRALAVDEATHGVRVNAVLPGSVDTPMLRTAAADWSDGTPEGVERLVADWGLMHPLGRVGQPREIGNVCAFLASEDASFITGAEIRVDGGLLARSPSRLPSRD